MKSVGKGLGRQEDETLARWIVLSTLSLESSYYQWLDPNSIPQGLRFASGFSITIPCSLSVPA